MRNVIRTIAVLIVIAAMAGGFVWPIGGVGEHWYVFHQGDEGCSESDWLRFNLDLWRFTGQTNYLTEVPMAPEDTKRFYRVVLPDTE